MTEKEKLRSQFADLSEKCTLCFRERKENGKETENCHIGCETNKTIQKLRTEMGKHKAVVIYKGEDKRTQKLFPEFTKEKYLSMKAKGMLDKEIMAVIGISKSTMRLRKKEWGIKLGRGGRRIG